MNILVTGGAGFIGSRVAQRLLNLNHKVLICDNLSTGLKKNLDARAKFIHTGAESPELLVEIEKFNVDAIAHIGGNSSGEIGETFPVNDITWNVQSTLNLLTIAQKLKIKKFIYASSMGVYGKSQNAGIFEESIAATPISIYGTGKLCSEQYLKTFENRGIDSLALRMFNVYGPGQNLLNQKQGMISIYMEQRLRGPKIQVRGSLERVRDFVYIDDVVDVWVRALLGNIPQGFSQINISTGIGTTIRDVLNEIEKSSGSIEIELQQATPADQDIVIGDNSKAKKELNWTPSVDLSEGIKRMWAWAEQQKL